MELWFHSLLRSVLDEREWPASYRGHLISRKELPLPTEEVAGSASDPVWTVWRSESFLFSPESETQIVQPIA